MSGNITVLLNEKRYNIKTLPSQIINDLLLEGCKRAGILNPEEYSLKYRSNILDLSLPVRLAGFPAGAKLTLVKQKYLEQDIKVALQIVDREKRLIKSFPADTTLWEILCHFEQTTEPPINITRRSVAVKIKDQVNQYYEMPIVRIISKEFSGPEVLEKITLASQGIVNGSVVLYVKFEKIQKCFNEMMALLPQKDIKLLEKNIKMDIENISENKEDTEQTKSQISEKPLSQIPKHETSEEISIDELISKREILVLSKPTSSNLYASKVNTNEEDHEMTLEMAIFYQNILSSKAKRVGNNRNSNIHQELEQENNLKKKYNIKFKLPDGMQIIGSFEGNERIQALYDFIRYVIQYSDEPFYLYTTPPPKHLLNVKGTLASNPNFSSKTIVIFKWADNAQSYVKEHSTLKDTYLNMQKDISTIITSLKDEEDEEEKEEKKEEKKQDLNLSAISSNSPSLRTLNSKKKPKWLKLSK
ncbi:hypothetical protein T552_00612 [Pneumocystis carinii B80]|uniref:UBX domain-containing protein n=1 Tax=Pneumocystis carinii (strain B80) TaxID=1408658 RepID=A0A0W4ZP61_PNEC8|nr:hypothetical protein T552_00612 [Pneumocystis carinii B80]KTW30134.1 hypothetical protein T552_00612 [Pneumocystis carinii B80]